MSDKRSNKTKPSSYKGIPPVGEPVRPEKKHSFNPGPSDGGSTMFILITILLVFIVIGVAAIVFLFMDRFQPPAPPIEPNITGPTNITNVTPAGCDDNCLLSLAISSNDYTLCENISNLSLIQRCYLGFANQSLDACLKIQDKDQLQDCVIFHAKANDDIGICSNLGTAEAEYCKGQVNPCLAKSGTERKVCLAIAKDDYALCQGDEECIFNYSITKSSSTACSALEESPKEYACKSLVAKQDLCYDLKLQSQKDYCYQIYAIRSKNSAICPSISTDSLYALECLSYFAIEENNLHHCDYLSLNNRWDCYINYSMGTKDTSGCVAIDRYATTAKFKCFYDFAKEFGDPSACDLINDAGQTTTCYVGAIMNNTNLDVSTCGKVARDVWKNKCFTQYALMEDDPSYCDFIATENERNICLDLFD